MRHLEPQQLIGSSTLFRDVHPHEAAAIIAQLQPISYPQGTHIIERGVWNGHFYIIASGSVCVLLQESEGSASEITVGRLGPGECFGEISLITGEAPIATVRAEEDTALWSLSHADFLRLIGECPTLPRNINQILSLRLARTNQQILFRRKVKQVWLAFFDTPGALLERSLALHIAQSVAECSRERVLVLELCSHELAVGPHFAVYTDQVRPSLLACTQTHSLLERHKAPTITIAGQHFPALATLVDQQEDLSQAAALSERALATLTDLAALYDYLLLVTTQTTPVHLVQVAADLCQRAVVLISAHDEAMRSAQLAASLSRPPFLGSSPTRRFIFVAHVPERPTIGVQDRYAAQLGLGAAGTPLADVGLTGLLPADTPLLEQCWKQQSTLSQLMPAAALTQAVNFVARHITLQTVGIAFGGGGARGFAHIGVLKRLLEYGIPLDYISACSIGVVTPGMYLSGRSLEEIEATFLQMQHYIRHWSFPRTSILSNKGVKRAFQDLCGTLCFEDLSTPFAVVAVDLETRTGVVLDRGPIWRAGLASVALPGIFPPVLIGKQILMDAGMQDPVPISVLRKMGADILVAAELSEQVLPAPENPLSGLAEAESNWRRGSARSPHIIDLLLRSYDVAMATIGKHSIREADVVIHPKLHHVSLRQFSEGHKFVAAGYEAVEEALPALQERLPWLADRVQK